MIKTKIYKVIKLEYEYASIAKTEHLDFQFKYQEWGIVDASCDLKKIQNGIYNYLRNNPDNKTVFRWNLN